MTPMLRVTALLLAFVGQLTGSPQRFRSSTAVVSVHVVVINNGAVVRDLERGDFLLSDNGVPQTLRSVELSAQPIDVTVLLGGVLLKTQQQQLSRTIAGVHRLRSAMREIDRLRLIECTDDVRESWPMQRADASIDIGPPEARVRFHGDYTSLGMPLNDALLYAFARPAEVGRAHLIIAMTSGFDSWSLTGSDMLPLLAQRSNATLYALVFDSPGEDSRYGDLGPTRLAAWRRNFQSLRDAVRVTGGALHRIENGTDEVIRVFRSIRESYLIQYVPSGVSDSGWHELEVRVSSRRGVVVRSRKGYFAG